MTSACARARPARSNGARKVHTYGMHKDNTGVMTSLERKDNKCIRAAAPRLLTSTNSCRIKVDCGSLGVFCHRSISVRWDTVSDKYPEHKPSPGTTLGEFSSTILKSALYRHATCKGSNDALREGK